MTSTLDSLQIRKALGRDDWSVPTQHGPDGWYYLGINDNQGQVIISASGWPGLDVDIIHASIARPSMPTYFDLKLLHKAVFPGFAYQVFAPIKAHVNIAKTALHLWGRADGKAMTPDFGMYGTI